MKCKKAQNNALLFLTVPSSVSLSKVRSEATVRPEEM